MLKFTAVLAACLALTSTVVAQEKTKRKPGAIAEVDVAKGLKMKFCWIPAGEMQLGSTKVEREQVLKLIEQAKEPAWLQAESEESRGKFKTKGFWLGKYEVTQQEWAALMNGDNPSYFLPTRDQMRDAGIKDTKRFPVENVSWDDCEDFLRKLNAFSDAPREMGKGTFVLPHEDEWEYACRGGSAKKQTFYFGNELSGKDANCDGTLPFGTDVKGPRLKRTTEVGAYEKIAPHPYGLCDMHGNVLEWCESEATEKDAARRVRGGSWGYAARTCRSAFRGHAPAKNADVGLRVCFRPE